MDICWLVPVCMTSLQRFLKWWLLEIKSIPYFSASSHALVTHVVTSHKCCLSSSLNTCLINLVPGTSWSLFRYDRIVIWQYILGDIWPHSPTTITLLVVDLTCTTYRNLWRCVMHTEHHNKYRQVSNIRHTLERNKIVDHSDVVGASPVGAAPTTSSFST